MQPGVIINRKELSVALLMLGKRELSDVISVSEDFRPTDEVVREMVLKHFFVVDDSGKPGWNDFVYLVLWSAANAESELRFDALHGHSCRLFFKGDTIILLCFGEGEDDGFIFYFLSAIPQAVGGLADALSWVEESLGTPAQDKAESLPKPLLVVRGWKFGEPYVTAMLERVTDTPIFRWSTAKGDAGSEQLGFYALIQKMIPWVVDAHRLSILAKGEIDVT